MKILFSPTSPFVRKCLVTAMELGIDRRITLLPSSAHPVNRDRSIVVDNPLGQVPTFYTDDGQVLYDSRVICEYLNHLAGGSLFPPEGPARWEALTLQSLGDGMLDAALLARYETAARPLAQQWPEWKAAQLDKVQTSIAALGARAQTLAGRVDIGTLTIACALWYLDLRFPELGWRPHHPALAEWYGSFSQRPALAASWSPP